MQNTQSKHSSEPSHLHKFFLISGRSRGGYATNLTGVSIVRRVPPCIEELDPHHINDDAQSSIRIYVLDWAILAYLLREKWATSQQLAFHFNRSRRTINKHLRKLEKLNLVERHGRTRCCFQWYSIPRENEPAVAEIVRKLRRDFVAGRTYVIFTVLKNQASLEMLPFQVPNAECPQSTPAVPSSSVSSLVLRFRRPLSVRVQPPRKRNEYALGRPSGSLPFSPFLPKDP